MGQKTNPIAFRAQAQRSLMPTKWYGSQRDFGELVAQDESIRAFFAKKHKQHISRLEISRSDRLVVTIRSVKTNALTMRGAGDANGEALKKILLNQAEQRYLTDVFSKDKSGRDERHNAVKKMINSLHIDVIDERGLSANVSAESVASQLEARITYRRAMKKVIQEVMGARAKGIKIMVAGRLGGAEIARTEHFSEGLVGLHTLRNDIDYAHATAQTTYGKIGVKVWINRGPYGVDSGQRKSRVE